MRSGLAVAVVLAETAIHLRPGHWLVAVAVAAIAVLRFHRLTAAFVAALALCALAPLGAYVLLLWLSFQAGREVTSRAGTIVIICAATGQLAGQLVVTADVRLIGIFLIFVALPLLVGRYLAQNERLVATLRANERLRLARDMHDSLGHRLSLVAVQAAALEVSDLPAPQHQAVTRLAHSTREAMAELYTLVGALRGNEVAGKRLSDVEDLAGGFSAAGVAVTVETRGGTRALPEASEQAAYRVIEEGLTNAAKHTEQAEATVKLEWERDCLLVSVTNPGAPADYREGNGLRGLRERVEVGGGLLDHRVEDGEFRLNAMFPAAGRSNRVAVAVGISIAVLMFLLLPATLVVGVVSP